MAIGSKSRKMTARCRERHTATKWKVEMSKLIRTYMLTSVSTGFLVSGIALPGVSSAQDFSQSITRSIRPLAEPYSEAEPTPGTAFKATFLEAARPVQEITVGLGYTHAESGAHEVLAPLQYGHTTASRAWNFRLETGYGERGSAGAHLRGLKDLKIFATNVLKQSDAASGDVAWRLFGALGLGIPVHGDLGSTRYAQQGRLIGAAAEGQWTAVLAGVATHFNSQATGLGSMLTAVHAEVQYGPSGNRKLMAKFDRSYLHGASGESVVTIEYDWTLFPAWEGVAFANRGLTTGKRNTGAAFDLTHRF